jgi:hypothetical protein
MYSLTMKNNVNHVNEIEIHCSTNRRGMVDGPSFGDIMLLCFNCFTELCIISLVKPLTRSVASAST